MVQFDPQMVAQMLMQPIQRASENLGGGPFGIGADAGGSYFVDPEVAARTGYGTAVTGTSFFPGAGIVDAYGGAVDITGQPLPSFSENIREGQFTDAGLQALGVAGDIATIAAPLTGGASALVGAMMKAPRAAQKIGKGADSLKSGSSLFRYERKDIKSPDTGAVFYSPDKTYAELYKSEDSVLRETKIPENFLDIQKPEDQGKAISWISTELDRVEKLSDNFQISGVRSDIRLARQQIANGDAQGISSALANLNLIYGKENNTASTVGMAEKKLMQGLNVDAMSIKEAGRDVDEFSIAFKNNPDVASDVGSIAKVEPPKSDTDSLIVQHNINEVSLKRSEELGGLPVPSMAISKVNEPLTSFGDITLVGPKDLAKPGAKNPVYRADAYTTRRPRTEVFPNDELENFVAERIVKPFDDLEAVGRSGISDFDTSGVAEAIYRGEEGSYSSIPLRAAYLKEKGQLPEFKNKFEVSSFIRSEFRETEDYYNWIESLRQDALNVGGTADEKIFLGFTPSGNRRYAPATLENIVKEMKKNKGAGKEGFMLSMGSLRAKLTPKLKNQKEISKSRNKIVSKEEFEKAKDQASETFGQFLNDIRDVVPEKTDFRTVEGLFEDIILGDLGKYEYSKPFEPLITEKMMQQGKKVRDLLVDMPTEYFEIKPQRAVNLSEFKGAIVPDNALESSIKALKNSGIEKIYKYKNEAERKALFKKFPELMFSAGGFGLGLSATSQMMQGEMSD